MQHSKLNDAQKQAVLTTEGRVLILAGAGSGKTSVLTHRIAHLIENLQVSPKLILGLTFTNKAAKEMKERIASLVGHKMARQITLSTFHSFCMQLLRQEIHHLGYTKHFSLYDEKDIKRLTKNLAHAILEQEGELPPIDEALEQISYAKAKGISLEGNAFSMELKSRLEACMRAYNAVDFDSLLSLTVELLSNYPEILQKYQDQYRYVMIDEYQDTSPIQYQLAELLTKKSNNLCVVGDDDQSIYGWRGAEIKNILNFEATTVIKLEQNYRSTPTILHAANAVIAQNKNRHAKTLFSHLLQGDKIEIFHAPTEIEEAQSVVHRMIKLHTEKNIPWKEMAILYRSNVLSRAFELALLQTPYQKEGKWVRGIPFEVFGGTEFTERAEIKDVMAYLKAIHNPLDQEALLRIINVPRRGISDKTLDHLTKLNRSHGLPLWNLLSEIASPLSSPFKADLSDKVIQSIRSFVTLLETAKQKFATPPLHTALSWLLDEIDYQKAITDDVKSDKMRDFKWENVAHCVDALAIYEEEAQNLEEEISLSQFLSTTLLDQEKIIRKETFQKEDRVSLMTFHSAKGLEFTACYLVCLEDHIIPHEKSLLETGLEEERRLMYVALTRAKKHLTLSMARVRKKMGKEIATNPSRFLLEIPKELLQVSSWKTS